MRIKFAILLALIVLVVGGWTGGWFWVRDRVTTEMDRAIADLAADGITVDCPDRAATGWPFRLEVSCANPVIALPDGSRIEAAALAATGHVMDPRLIIAALKAPLRVTGPDGNAAMAEFSSLRASLRFADDRVERLSAEATDLRVEGGPAGQPLGRLTADRGEIHLRPTEGGQDAELVATVSGATGDDGGTALLPGPADAGVEAVLTNAALFDGTASGLAAWARAGGQLDVRQAVLAVGDTRLSATGTGSVSPEGAVDARLEATASGVAWLTEQVKAGQPVPPALATLASAFLLLGRPVEGAEGARRIVIDVTDGAIKANGLPVGSVPAAF